MIKGWTGLPGASKTTSLAKEVVNILYRNEDYLKKTGQKRPIYSNITISEHITSEFETPVIYYKDVEELTKLKDCDVIIDEATVYFDSRLWETLSTDIRRWLRQHRKLGVEIYFTAQEFQEVDISFRRLVNELIHLEKILGSRDISATMPPPKYIWGIVLNWNVNPVAYDEKKKQQQKTGLPSISLITRQDTEIFDTREEVKQGKYAPLKHIERFCEDPTCRVHKIGKVIHV